MPKQFGQILVKWAKENFRELPWKEDNDPYKIWISEIILQQTRISQGLPYYLKFVKKYPDVFALAKAPENEVLKLWEGLGYYSRARNLHHTSKVIAFEFNGRFPNTYEELLKLKGIGPYTAAAIASFAFGKSHPVVDGNVLRLISRYFGIENSIDEGQTKKYIEAICESAIRDQDPAIFNQAIMDFGSQICSPKKSKCENCVFQSNCVAFDKQMVSTLPKRTKKIRKRERYFLFVIEHKDGKVIIEKRIAEDIWKGLYQFPLIETTKVNFDSNGLKEIIDQKYDVEIETISQSITNVLTHQTIRVKFVFTKNFKIGKGQKRIKTASIYKYAFPRVITRFLDELSWD